jgi:hypothetical protein
MNNRQSILYLVRGLPGSGKTSFVKYQLHALVNHYEADMYFVDPLTGEYKFDSGRLHLAHIWCQEQTHKSLQGGFDTWVSNTFTTKKELRPYFEIAKITDSALVVMTMNGNFKSVHNVPDESMKRMRDRFEYDISELYLNMA